MNSTTPSPNRWLGAPVSTLALAAVFGLVFGFLLQKGGVANIDILIGVLLLEDFTVVRVMGVAILVGIVGVSLGKRLGWLEPKVPKTRLRANSAGGLIFGAGFALLAYCPGTNAAALGQGNLDAFVGVLGLVAGSYAYARWQPDATIEGATASRSARA